MSKIYQLLVNNLKIFKPSNNLNVCKVEKILKGRTDSIPSHSSSNYGRESFLEVFRQNIAGPFKNKKFVNITL